MKAKENQQNAPTTGTLSVLRETINKPPPLLTHHHNRTSRRDMGIDLSVEFEDGRVRNGDSEEREVDDEVRVRQSWTRIRR
ncbi:hypothetical protein OIU78_021469 [Salix suchowensis]|nr:hypothetical protein OIU78_021469 [Salix suchowensis]